MISCIMDQESFALDGKRPNSTTNIFGIVQIHSESSCFTPPVWTQVQLIGREQIGNTCRTIVNDTYQLSTYSSDWRSSCTSLSSSVDSISSEYSLPFSIPVSSNIPASFQIYDQQEEFVYCRIYYTLEIKVSLLNQSISQPIHFYRSNAVQYHKTLLFNQEDSPREEYAIPKRVFWGITKQSKQRWQYELEFPSTFDLANSKSGNILLRLRSVGGKKNEATRKGSCLIVCQNCTIDSFRRVTFIDCLYETLLLFTNIDVHNRYSGCIQVLATSTKLITNPNKTWLEPCQVDFDFEKNSALPTVDNQRLGIEHFIRITVEFCNEEVKDEYDYCKLDLQFPITFTGYILEEQTVTERSTNQEISEVQSSSSSGSSISSYGETVALAVPLTYKSLCNYSPQPIAY